MNQFELRQEPEDKVPSELQKLRWGIGADILIQMDEPNAAGETDLPQPNVWALSEIMQAVFTRDGYEDSLPENSRWRPSASYWAAHLAEIRKVLRDEKKQYFEFFREDGEFKGMWQFVGKKEYEAILTREYQDMSTRGDTYNERVDDSKWQLRVPKIAEIPRIAN